MAVSDRAWIALLYVALAAVLWFYAGDRIVVHAPPPAGGYYVAIDTDPSGVGHRLSALVFGMLIANDTNATLVVPRSFWAAPAAHHGSMDWVPRALQLRFASSAPVGSYVLAPTRSAALQLARTRSVRCPTGMYGFCEGWYCMANWPGAYARARPYFEVVGRAFRRRPCEQVVAWHVRLGDDVTATDEALVRMARRMAAVTASRQLEHHVYSNGALCDARTTALEYRTHKRLGKPRCSTMPFIPLSEPGRSALLWIQVGSPRSALPPQPDAGRVAARAGVSPRARQHGQLL